MATRSSLYEESAISLREAKEAKFYSVFRAIALVFFVLGAIMLVYTLNYSLGILGNPDLNGAQRAVAIAIVAIMNLSLFGVGLCMWFMKNRFNISYDYIFVEDELRLTKVFNGRKRKFITTVKMDQVLKIGWVDKPSYDATVRGLQGKKPHILTPNRTPAEGKDFYYLLVSGSLGKSLYVLECRMEMLEHLVFAAGRTKLERE